MTTSKDRTNNVAAELASLIRSIPDFPVEGILFRDITPLLADPAAVKKAVEAMLDPFDPGDIQAVAGIEARGFIFGALLADHLGKAFVPIRKVGKLPYETFRAEYELEYGRAVLEVHTDAVNDGDRVLLVDDLLATGGTSRAAVDLLRSAGAEMAGAAYLIELGDLRGREKLQDISVHSVISYD